MNAYFNFGRILKICVTKWVRIKPYKNSGNGKPTLMENFIQCFLLNIHRKISVYIWVSILIPIVVHMKNSTIIYKIIGYFSISFSNFSLLFFIIDKHW